MGVTVKREKPDHRRHHRVTAPLFVRVDGGAKKFRAHDWSLGGLRLDGFTYDLPPVGLELSFELTLPFQGFDISFDVKGRVVRINADLKSLAVEFTHVGERERALMTHFIEDLVRGVMSPVAESIQRIDVPVTPVTTEADPNPKNTLPVKRVHVRQIAWLGIYAALGFVVFGYTALVLYSNLFRMEVQSAVVESPVVRVQARGDGQLPFIRIRTGDMVTEGETVIYFADDELEKQIDLAKVDIGDKEALLAQLLQRRGNEVSRMSDYAEVEDKTIEQLTVEHKAYESEYLAAKQKLDRLSAVFKRGHTTRSKVEDASSEVTWAFSRMENKRIELKSLNRQKRTIRGKFFFDGNQLVGDVGKYDADIVLARQRVAIAHQGHEALLKHRERLAIKAPFDGSVASMPHTEAASVKRGDLIAVFQKDGERFITAFLTQDEVMKVGLGDYASVYFPALDSSIRGRVVDVDRTSGFKEEVSRRYSWRGAEDRSAEVKLELLVTQKEEVAARVTPGLPAVVLFEAQSTNPIFAAMWRKVSALFL